MKQIEIPEELYAQFIDVLYAGLVNIKETEVNQHIRFFMMYLIEQAVENKDILIIDGKIVDRKEFLNE